MNIKREELLIILRANREKHVLLFQQACTGYRKLALAKVQEEFDRLKKTINELKEGKEFLAGVYCSFSLPAPVSHEKSYVQAIRMMELEVEDVVKLTSDQFACFVMDDWEWKESWRRGQSQFFGGVTMNYSPEAEQELGVKKP